VYSKIFSIYHYSCLHWSIGKCLQSHLSSFSLPSSVSCQLDLKALLTSSVSLTVTPSPHLHSHHFQVSSWVFSASTAVLCITTTGSLLLDGKPFFRVNTEVRLWEDLNIYVCVVIRNHCIWKPSNILSKIILKVWRYVIHWEGNLIEGNCGVFNKISVIMILLPLHVESCYFLMTQQSVSVPYNDTLSKMLNSASKFSVQQLVVSLLLYWFLLLFLCLHFEEEPWHVMLLVGNWQQWRYAFWDVTLPNPTEKYQHYRRNCCSIFGQKLLPIFWRVMEWLCEKLGHQISLLPLVSRAILTQSVIKLEATGSLKMQLPFYLTTRCHSNPEDSKFHIYCHDNLKSQNEQFFINVTDA
jgi:hypothetical protein